MHMKKLKFVVEKHRDGYVAYPLGLKGAVVGEGASYESALADARSAAAFHIESFGKEAFDDQDDVMEASITEARSGSSEIQWSDWGERHGRLSRKGSGRAQRELRDTKRITPLF